MFRVIVGFMVLLFIGCVDDSEEEAAKKLYELAEKGMETQDYRLSIEILQSIRINYENTRYANYAEKEIEKYQSLIEMKLDNRRDTLSNKFKSIGRALENYKARFQAFPLTPQGLDKLPADIVPNWEDTWGNDIFYKPLYSSPSIPRHSPDDFILASFGKDGLPGGVEEDQDFFYRNGSLSERMVLN